MGKKDLIEYFGPEGLRQLMILIKTALAGKQDKMEEITAEETQQMWNDVVSANTVTKYKLKVTSASFAGATSAELIPFDPSAIDQNTHVGVKDETAENTWIFDNVVAQGEYSLSVNGEPTDMMIEITSSMALDAENGVITYSAD